MAQNNNEFFGYTLFNDVEDEQIRTHNRAMTLRNIMEDNLDEKGKPTAKAAHLTFGYFNLVPENERKSVYDELETYFASKRASV